MRRTNAIMLLGIAIVGAGLLASFRHMGAKVSGGDPGFPLDDAWIHVRFAQNFASGNRFAFNPGEPTAGSTAPLWVVALAGGAWVAHLPAVFGELMWGGGLEVLFLNPSPQTRDVVLAAFVICVLSYFLLALETYHVTRRSLEGCGAAFLAALIVLVNVRVVWAAFSGMEICLAAFLALAAAGLFAAEESTSCSNRPPDNGAAPDGAKNSRLDRLRPWAVPVLFGLASLARPEAHLLFALAVFLRIVRACRRDTPIGEFFRLVPYRMMGVYLLITVPWHLFAQFSSGSVLPNTFWANFRGLATRIIPPGFYLNYTRWLFILDHPWVYWLVIPGIAATVYWTFRPDLQGPDCPTRYGLALAQLASLWAICYPAASRMILPLTRHHARYMIPMTPFHAILAVLGLLAVVRLAARLVEKAGSKGEAPAADGRLFPTTGRILAATRFWLAAAFLVALFAGPRLIHWSGVYGRNVYSINRQHVNMARYLGETTLVDAVVATHDIGAIGAISQRRVIDLFGLVTPDMIHEVETVIPTIGTAPRWYLERLHRSGATHLVGYPEWLPFVLEAPECFEEFHHATLEEVDICGGLDMVAYYIDRDRLAGRLSKP